MGCNSTSGITLVKGPPVLTASERASIIESCKWVQECLHDTPYTTSEQTLDEYNCKYYIHGDDPCYGEDGYDICARLAERGRFKLIKRTTGVSTTDITGRLLRLVSSDSIPVSVKEAPQ